MAATGSPLLALPDDLLTRVLVGVNRDDHDAAAAACGAFRAVIRGPRFLRLRRESGFAERAIVLVETARVPDYGLRNTVPLCERANDGSWSRYEAVAPEAFRDCGWALPSNGPHAAFGSVLLG